MSALAGLTQPDVLSCSHGVVWLVFMSVGLSMRILVSRFHDHANSPAADLARRAENFRVADSLHLPARGPSRCVPGTLARALDGPRPNTRRPRDCMRPAAFAVRPHAPDGLLMFAQVAIKCVLRISKALLTMQLIC